MSTIDTLNKDDLQVGMRLLEKIRNMTAALPPEKDSRVSYLQEEARELDKTITQIIDEIDDFFSALNYLYNKE